MSKSPSDHRQDANRNHHAENESPSENWWAVFRQVEGGLRRFLGGKLPQPSDVDDCLQAITVAMLKNTTEIPPAARRAWLYRVAAREAARWWRKKSTSDRVLEQHAHDNYAVETTPTPAIETQETVDRINLVIDELPEDTRLIVRARLHDGKTFQTIADELQLPLGTVLTKMRRAMQRIRDRLDPPHSD